MDEPTPDPELAAFVAVLAAASAFILTVVLLVSAFAGPDAFTHLP